MVYFVLFRQVRPLDPALSRRCDLYMGIFGVCTHTPGIAQAIVARHTQIISILTNENMLHVASFTQRDGIHRRGRYRR